MWSRPFVSFSLYYILSTLLYTMTLLKRLSSEFKHDTWYHIAISVAVLLKILFLLTAIIVFYGSETQNTDTPFFRKMVKLKDICNQCSIILVCAIMIYLFNPSRKCSHQRHPRRMDVASSSRTLRNLRLWQPVLRISAMGMI